MNGMRAWPWPLMVCAIALMCAIAGGGSYFAQYDFGAWGGDWARLQQCRIIRDAGGCEGLSKFPLAYLLNSAWVHESPQPGMRLAWLNVAFLALPLAWLATLRGKQAFASAGAYIAAICLSPLPYFYVHAAALEVQAGIVAGIYLGTLGAMWMEPGLRRRPVAYGWLIGTALLFPLYKDTVVVIVLLAILVSLATLRLAKHWQRRRNEQFGEARLAGITAAGLLALVPGGVAALAYNQYRYASLAPVAYLEEARQTSPLLVMSLEFLAGGIASPNGGVVIFWSLPFAVLALLLWLTRHRLSLAGILPALVAAGGALVSFSLWWAAFGWSSWGDRLMLQPMLSLLVAMLLTAGTAGNGHAPIRKSLRSMGAWAILASIPVLASAYYFAIPYRSEREDVMGASLWPGPACEVMRGKMETEATIMGPSFWRTSWYYDCARERLRHVPRP